MVRQESSVTSSLTQRLAMEKSVCPSYRPQARAMLQGMPAAHRSISSSRIAAQRLRWATQLPVRSPDPAGRFDDVDKVLAALDALLAEARAMTPRDDGLLRRVQRDRAAAARAWPSCTGVAGDLLARVPSLSLRSARVR